MNLMEHLLYFSASFNNNYMKVNGDKNHFLVSENKAIANIANDGIESEDKNELLG